MTIKIAVCDDDSADRHRLITLIKTKDSSCEWFEYKSGEELLWDFESGIHFDMFFLDIFMNGITGLDVARRIRNINPDAILIFISSCNDFYRESFDLYAFNYLLKPVTLEKLTEVYSRALERINKDVEQGVRISFKNSLHTIRHSQILYVSSNQHVINFFLKNGQTLKSYGKLDDFVIQLPSEIFVRCHKSYIVNLKYVTSITSSEFALGETKIPISRNHYKQTREKFYTLMFGDF